MKGNVVIKIKDLLKIEGRSQTWLAEKIGVSKHQMYQWTSVNGVVPSVYYVIKIMKVTGWKFEDMFEIDE